MLTEFGKILIFLIIGVLFTGVGLLTAWLIRPHRPYPAKNAIYECGEDTIGSSWVKFNIRFYVVALIFVIFEVETVVLFPWAIVFHSLGMFGFLEMVVFLGILIVGYIYVWAKGDLDWDKPSPVIPVYVKGVGVVPQENNQQQAAA